MIEVEGLFKQYSVDAGSVHALHDVTLRLGNAERLGLLGPSGSGKTTLLRCIAGLEVPEKGIIRIGGVEVFNSATHLNTAPWARPIGVVFQDYALWPHLRVVDNILFPLRYGRNTTTDKVEQRRRAENILQKVRLSGLEERFPSELSGGQRQRVALARALVAQPSVLLMDEPFSSLDPHLRKQTRNEFVEILENSGITTIFVSHDPADGLFMTNVVGFMREGSLVQLGAPRDVYMQPADQGVAESLDVGALIPCLEEHREGGTSRYRLAQSHQHLEMAQCAENLRNGELFLLIRDDAVRLWKNSEEAATTQKLLGRVVREGYTGRGWCVLVDVAGTTFEVLEREQPGTIHGSTIELAVDTQRVQILGPRCKSAGGPRPDRLDTR